ncbi:MAG TPA: phospholipase D-like domain-containing protein [Rubrobacteraceae bacterium]|nr:phospholipase D-like domain-containing protein [Rubrobacteraceae bacterium]
MLSSLRRLPSDARAGLADLRKIGVRVFLALTAVQAVLVAALVALAQLRKRREEPREGFPWAEMPEVQLESGAGTLKLYPYGVDLYEAMISEIEAASENIFLETFIWKGDELGQRFVDALARKAREGVRVCVIFDGFANMVVPAKFKEFPEEIQTLQFRPISSPSSVVDPRNLLRDHRKLLTVDGRVAFLGGYNIGQLYARGWRDTHLRIRGGEVREVENAFIDFWNAHHSESLPRIEPAGERAWNPDLVLHRNDPYLRIFPIRGVYLEAIDRAHERIYMTHAYFVPDRALRAHLIEAARRGVEVQLLLPWESNHITADWLSRRHFHALLEAGVRIFRYKHIMIHSKTATIDGVWSTVGTANIDRFSLLGNYEINLEIYSRRFAEQMERMFELDKTNAEELTLEEWERRPLLAKCVERILASLSPLV